MANTHRKKQKKKISIANSGENSFWYGKHHTEETKQHLSNLFKGTDKTLRKTPFTEEERERMRMVMKENSMMWSKKIRCIEDDIVFDCESDAARYYKRSPASISDVLHGRSKTCAGKTFEYCN